MAFDRTCVFLEEGWAKWKYFLVGAIEHLFWGFCGPNVNLSVGPKVCFFFYILNFQRGCRQRVRGRQLTYGVRVNRDIDRLITFHFNGTPDSSYNDARGMSVAAV